MKRDCDPGTRMGTHLLEGLPHTPKYRRLVALLGAGAGSGGGGAGGAITGGLEAVADETLNASAEGIDRAKADSGVAFCFYLLAQLSRAAKSKDFTGGLERIGIAPPQRAIGPPDAQGRPTPPNLGNYTLFRLTSAFMATVDGHLRRTRARTDLAELAELAAAESLTVLCADRSDTLFGAGEDTVQAALRTLGTRNGFARLAHDFFARFVRRYLEYLLSRELSNHVGPARRFANVDEHNEFLNQLDRHCRVATSVMRQFAGDWYSLHNFRDDVTPSKARGFTAHALDKVRGALRYMENRHVGQ